MTRLININYRHSLLYAILFILPLLMLVPTKSTAQNSKDADLLAQVESLKADAERYRGLNFLYDVPVELLDPSEVSPLIARLISDEIPEDQDRKYTDLYIMLGLMPRGSDFLDSYQSMTEEQVAGLYDPKAKTFYVVDINIADMYSSVLGGLGDVPGVGSLVSGFVNGLFPGINDIFGKAIILHELVHALDDQNYDIESALDEIREDNSDDTQLAYQSLLEGSATLAMNRYQLDALNEVGLDSEMLGANMSTDVSFAESLIDYEPFMERLMLVPYLKGTEFLQVAYNSGGTDGINEVFSDPPASMEQILHPEEYYMSRDIPSHADPVELAGVLQGWRSEADDNLGELITGMVFELNTGDQDLANRISAGWDYDTITTWRSPEGILAFSWITVWDTEKDATEFFDGYKQLLDVRYPGGTWHDSAANRAKYTGLGLASILERQGRVVAIIEGVPENKAEACLAKAWESHVQFN